MSFRQQPRSTIPSNRETSVRRAQTGIRCLFVRTSSPLNGCPFWGAGDRAVARTAIVHLRDNSARRVIPWERRLRFGSSTTEGLFQRLTIYERRPQYPRTDLCRQSRNPLGEIEGAGDPAKNAASARPAGSVWLELPGRALPPHNPGHVDVPPRLTPGLFGINLNSHRSGGIKSHSIRRSGTGLQLQTKSREWDPVS